MNTLRFDGMTCKYSKQYSGFHSIAEVWKTAVDAPVTHYYLLFY